MTTQSEIDQRRKAAKKSSKANTSRASNMMYGLKFEMMLHGILDVKLFLRNNDIMISFLTEERGVKQWSPGTIATAGEVALWRKYNSGAEVEVEIVDEYQQINTDVIMDVVDSVASYEAGYGEDNDDAAL